MYAIDICHLPDFYKGYVAKAGELPLTEALKASLQKWEQADLEFWNTLHCKTYFPGKWTANEVLQHIIDTERIMSYRALCIARGEEQPLPGYNENVYAAASLADRRSMESLISELTLLRKLTITLFESFDEAMLLQSGVANDNEIDVLALGFIIVGHERHHMDVLESYYFKLP